MITVTLEVFLYLHAALLPSDQYLGHKPPVEKHCNKTEVL